MTLRDRAGSAGIAQSQLARILGYSADGISRALRREPPDRMLMATIAAWEIMSAEQRRQWLSALDVPAERPRRGRPRKIQGGSGS